MCQIIFSSIIKINNYRVSNLMTSWHYFYINILYSRTQTIIFSKEIYVFQELSLILSIYSNLSNIHFHSHRIIFNVFQSRACTSAKASAFIGEINQQPTRYEILIVSSHATICPLYRINDVSTLLISIAVWIQLMSKERCMIMY